MKGKISRQIISFIIALAIILSSCTLVFSAKSSSILAYGVDVSKWQYDIDWQKVKADGIDFAIIRAGTTKGKDQYFEQNYKNAKAAGIEVGCYFYTYATTIEEAKADAELLMSWLDGKQLEYPVYYDMEDSVQLADGITKKLRTDMCMAFLDIMSQNNWYVGTYANQNWYSNYLDKATLGKKYELWLASWRDSGKPDKDFSAEYGMWQYTDKGKVNGISTAVDLDVAYKNYPEIIKSSGYNGYKVDIEEVDEEWIITSSNGVNVREGAGTSFEIVSYLPNGARIHVTGKVKGYLHTWGRITLDSGKTAWCVLTYAEQTVSKLKSANEKITIKDNLIIGVERGTIITADIFQVDGLAEINMPKEINCGTGKEVTLTLGNSTVNKYYVVVKGDINGDSYVDAFDVVFSLAVSNFAISYDPKSPEYEALDVNSDGLCDVNDTLLIDLMSVEAM